MSIRRAKRQALKIILHFMFVPYPSGKNQCFKRWNGVSLSHVTPYFSCWKNRHYFSPTVETPVNIKIQRGNAVYFKIKICEITFGVLSWKRPFLPDSTKKFFPSVMKKFLVKSVWNAKCDPVNFNVLKIFSVSWLNLDFVVFSLLVKKHVKNMAKLGWKHFTFSAEKKAWKIWQN